MLPSIGLKQISKSPHHFSVTLCDFALENKFIIYFLRDSCPLSCASLKYK